MSAADDGQFLTVTFEDRSPAFDFGGRRKGSGSIVLPVSLHSEARGDSEINDAVSTRRGVSLRGAFGHTFSLGTASSGLGLGSDLADSQALFAAVANAKMKWSASEKDGVCVSMPVGFMPHDMPSCCRTLLRGGPALNFTVTTQLAPNGNGKGAGGAS